MFFNKHLTGGNIKRILFISLILCISIVTLFEIFRPQQLNSSDKETIALEQGNDNHTASLMAKSDTLNAVKRWIRRNAIPLRTVIAGNGFKDLQPLKKIIGSAHLVALGEATHGTREFFHLKHRMLEFLVNEMGFTVFGIEASMADRPLTNSKWQKYEIVGKVSPDAEVIAFGLAMVGDGQAWFDSVSIKVLNE